MRLMDRAFSNGAGGRSSQEHRRAERQIIHEGGRSVQLIEVRRSIRIVTALTKVKWGGLTKLCGL